MHIFLLIFGICGKVSPSKSCSYARVPDSLLAEWEKSRVGLALKKITRPGLLPNYKDLDQRCLFFRKIDF